MNYKISIDYSAHGYNRTAFLVPDGAVVHETAAPGWSDERLQEYFDEGAGGRGVCSHAGIDWDSITEMVPLNRRAYHAGTHANCAYIGVELCHPKTHNPTQFTEVWKRAVWYFAHLFVDGIIPVSKHNYKVTRDNLMSHNEVSIKWPKDTNHVDPTAFFKEYGKTVDDFRAEIQKEINAQLAAATEARKEEAIIEKAIDADVITSGAYWLAVLRNTQKPNPAFIRQIFINATGSKSKDDSEVIAAAVRAGIIQDAEYWTKVLAGKVSPNSDYIEIILQRSAAWKG